MSVRDVLIIGAGIAGCAMALALVKKGIRVTIATSPSDQRLYHLPFISYEQLKSQLDDLTVGLNTNGACLIAHEQFVSFAKGAVESLLDAHMKDRNGNINIHSCLLDQLAESTLVEWLSNHSLVELLTLDKHSARQADQFQFSTCFGARFFDHTRQCLESITAKESVLATGGISSLYPYSTHPRIANGQGMALASQAGCRVVDLDSIYFQPLGFFERNQPGIPIPVSVLDQGGILHLQANNQSDWICPEENLAEQIVTIMVENNLDCIWLNLSAMDHAIFKENYPQIDAYCLDRGYNLAKDSIPVAPMARYTRGGIAVDKNSQTSVRRLRAVGEVACTGLNYAFVDDIIPILESLTWASACADNLSHYLDKFMYYVPEIKSQEWGLREGRITVSEDWRMLQSIMWSYAGICRTEAKTSRAEGLLEQLEKINRSKKEELTIDQYRFNCSLEAAKLVVKSLKVDEQ